MEELNFQWFSNLRVHQAHLDGVVKHCFLGSTLGVSDLIDLEWGLIIYISNKFPVEVEAADLETHFENP